MAKATCIRGCYRHQHAKVCQHGPLATYAYTYYYMCLYVNINSTCAFMTAWYCFRPITFVWVDCSAYRWTLLRMTDINTLHIHITYTSSNMLCKLQLKSCNFNFLAKQQKHTQHGKTAPQFFWYRVGDVIVEQLWTSEPLN